MADLISRAAAIRAALRWYVNPGGGVFNAIKANIRSNLEQVPAVDAVPVEWLHRKRKEALQEGMMPNEVDAVEMVMWMWQKEQEAR